MFLEKFQMTLKTVTEKSLFSPSFLDLFQNILDLFEKFQNFLDLFENDLPSHQDKKGTFS